MSMNTSINTQYVWRVFKNNKFAGYVYSPSEIDSMRKANQKFGSYVLIERIR